MEYDVYIDQVFVINLLFDCYLSGMILWWMSEKIVWWRFIIGNLLAALSGCIPFFFAPLFMPVPYCIYLFVSSLAYTGVISPSWSFFIRWWCASFLFGGGMLLAARYQIWVLLFTLIPFLVIVGKRMKPATEKRKRIVSCTMGWGNQRFCCRGFLDTGNQMYDPISSLPVIIADYEKVKQIMPPAYTLFVKELTQKQIEKLGEEEYLRPVELKLYRFRWIPYRTIENEGYLPGVIPDWVSVNGIKQKKKAVIAFVSKEETFSNGYACILHPALWKK